MSKYPYPFTVSQEMTDVPPGAYALVNGNSTYPDISGIVKFYETPYKGIILYAEFFICPSIHLTIFRPFMASTFMSMGIAPIILPTQAGTTILRTNRIPIMPVIFLPSHPAMVTPGCACISNSCAFRMSSGVQLFSTEWLTILPHSLPEIPVKR